MRMEIQEKVLGLMFEKAIKEDQRLEIKRLSERLKSM